VCVCAVLNITMNGRQAGSTRNKSAGKHLLTFVYFSTRRTAKP